MGTSLRKPSDTRWWSYYECIDCLLMRWNKFVDLFEELTIQKRSESTVLILKVKSGFERGS